MNHISHIHFRDNPGHAILSLGALQAVELIAKTGKEVVWLYVDYKIQYAIWTASDGSWVLLCCSYVSGPGI